MANELKPKWEAPKIPAGQVRPDVEHDASRRQTDTALRGHAQARAGEVPLTGETPARPISQHPVVHQVPAKDVPKPAGADRPVHAEPQHRDTPTATSQRATPTPDTAAMNQLVEAGKKALSDLNQLAQGGKNAKPVVTTGPTTPQAALRDALIAQFTLASKKPVQAGKESAKLPEKETPVAGARDDGKVRQPGERVGAEKVAEAVAQKNPFAADARPGRTEKREADRGKIATDGPTSRALDNVVTGRGISAIATAQEFSSGGDGGFGDPKGDSAGLAKKTSPVALPVVYGEGDGIYSDTLALCNHIAWSGVVGGGEPVEKRIRASIGDRISNTRDDVPLSERMGDAGYLQQAAYGTRFTPYGKGIIG